MQNLKFQTNQTSQHKNKSSPTLLSRTFFLANAPPQGFLCFHQQKCLRLGRGVSQREKIVIGGSGYPKHGMRLWPPPLPAAFCNKNNWLVFGWGKKSVRLFLIFFSLFFAPIELIDYKFKEFFGFFFIRASRNKEISVAFFRREGLECFFG